MKRHLLTACLLAATAAALPPGSAQASGGISRCATADGITVYTDAACGELGARSAPMSETLVRALAREGTTASLASTPAGALPAWTGSTVRPGGDKGLSGCPRTPDQLHAAFQASVAQGDVNELAAIYDWTDVSGRQSRDLLKRLERISRSRVQDVSFASNGIRRRAGCLLLAL